MKVLVIIALVAICNVRAGVPRERRSLLASGAAGGLYAGGIGAVGGVYAAHVPNLNSPIISSYTTARQLPAYDVPESTHVTTASNTIYRVQVPVTYTTTYAQPSVRHVSYYNAAPAHASYAPFATYAPAASYAGGAWGVAGVADVSSPGYVNYWW